MYNLVIFFREAFKFDESIANAAARKLSTKTDAELQDLRGGLDLLKSWIDVELMSRLEEDFSRRYSDGGPPFDAATGTGMYDHDC